jgi:hypothetical protein
MSVHSPKMDELSRELMPRVYRAVIDASHQAQRVTVVVGPEIWSDVLVSSELYHGMTHQDLRRNKIPLPRIMGVEIIDNQELEPRDVIVRSEVIV